MQLSSQVVEKMGIYVYQQGQQHWRAVKMTVRLWRLFRLQALQSFTLAANRGSRRCGVDDRSRKLRNDIAVTIQHRLSYKTVLVAIK